ncbi:sulfatase [Streptomyces sp. NPDC002308]
MTDSQFRLLPWNSPEGRRCYLSTDDPDSRMSRLADEVEADLVACGEDVLDGAREVLAGEAAVRFALKATADALRDVLRVAECREGRPPFAWIVGGVSPGPRRDGSRRPEEEPSKEPEEEPGENPAG